MLVLMRRSRESIIIGDNEIKITILSVSAGGQVKIGIEAAKDIKILRGELVDEKMPI